MFDGHSPGSHSVLLASVGAMSFGRRGCGCGGRCGSGKEGGGSCCGKCKEAGAGGAADDSALMPSSAPSEGSIWDNSPSVQTSEFGLPWEVTTEPWEPANPFEQPCSYTCEHLAAQIRNLAQLARQAPDPDWPDPEVSCYSLKQYYDSLCLKNPKCPTVSCPELPKEMLSCAEASKGVKSKRSTTRSSPGNCYRASCGGDKKPHEDGVRWDCVPKWKTCPPGWTTPNAGGGTPMFTMTDNEDPQKCTVKLTKSQWKNNNCGSKGYCQIVVAFRAGCACVKWDTQSELEPVNPDDPSEGVSGPAWHDPRWPNTPYVTTGRGPYGTGGDIPIGCAECNAHDGEWSWEGPTYGTVVQFDPLTVS